MKKSIRLLLACIALHAMLSACSGERYSELMNASKDGNNKAVLRAIGNGANVNERTSQGKTALMLAASEGHLDTVKLLIENGADVNAEDNFGTSSIIVASTANKYDVIEELVKRGANTTKRDTSGGSALDNAVFWGHEKSVDILLQGTKKIDPDQASELLLYSASLGRMKIVESLLNFGIDVNIAGKEQRTALIVASKFDQPDMVKYLLGRGADKTLKDSKGKTALDIARESGNKKVVEALQTEPPASKAAP